MAKIPSLVDMLKAGAHFGHRTSRWHPKMDPYIFGNRGGVHIINLEITQKKMEEAGEFLKKLATSGGTLLFVGTKKQSQKLIEEKAGECDMPFVSQRWIGGTITNFRTIRERVKYFLDLKKKQESGELKKYTKKEQHDFAKEIHDLDIKIGGLSKLEKLPTAVFITDLKQEKTALREAKVKGLPIVAICDSNVSPIGIDYPIPANDDAMKSINMMVNFVAEAFKEGVALRGVREEEKKVEDEKEKKTNSSPKATNDKEAPKEEKKVEVKAEKKVEKKEEEKIEPKAEEKSIDKKETK